MNILRRWFGASSPEASVLMEDVGIGTLAGFTPLIARGAALPASFTEVFSTAEDNQAAVQVGLSARNPDTSFVRALDVFDITGIARKPKGMPRIQVAVAVDVRGEATVAAQDQDSGRKWEGRLGRVKTGPAKTR